MRRILMALVALLGLIAVPARAEDAGRLIEYERVEAAGLPPQRLTIWLPPGYDSSDKRYPVLYMHDGHNLFDLKNSNFNKIWAADKAMLRVMGQGIEPRIIVGIWAPGKDRFRQYLPRPAYDAAPPALKAKMDEIAGGPVISDAYLAWLAGPLKAWVDASFRTRPGRDDTAIAGSSMGGLMSCYAIAARPDVYGQAACVSSHWPAIGPDTVKGFNPDTLAVWTSFFDRTLGAPTGRRVWMDHGTATLDAFYAPYQEPIDGEFAKLGWQRGTDFESRVYPGAEHEENAWAARLPEILAWLLRR
ncbi:esterase [Novosphingobium sediminis]|uniref:Esterase n=1 Tax=Novosphingobium sediminis TaxID=707214 RepID=A0A512AFA8_9SPHN|nr:alpha/beta hydrolase-fold protein [Novosphingobium sediminis]GEN98385.1 esterase [Novosphingobium sediminis]